MDATSTSLANTSSTTSSTNTSSTSSKTSSTKTDSSALSIDDFFTLLAAQLQNQDMFNPVQDTEFIAQMAQFSSLQQMQDLSSAFQSTYAISLVGKNVVAKYEDSNGDTQQITGTVDKIVFNSGTPYLEVNGTYVEAGDIVTVTNSTETTSTDTTTNDTSDTTSG